MIDKKIKMMNKDVKEYNTLIQDFYQNLYNYHNEKLKRDGIIELGEVNTQYKEKVFKMNETQEEALKNIINQYEKDKNDSDAKNKETITYKGCNIIIRKGDLTEEREDAIVNPANEDLNHKGGAAKIIAQKGGEVIRTESEEYIKKYGNLPTGEATTTNAGDLPCEKVIHVVGPVYPQNSMRDQKQREELRNAVKSILREMRRYKMNSVSFPAISTGIFRFPLELCAMIIGDVLKEAIDNDPEFYKDKKLIICNFDEKTTNKMLEYTQNSLTETSMFFTFRNIYYQNISK